MGEHAVPVGERLTSQDEWWRSGVVYQIWPRSFADGNGDGVGDLLGVIERLDHLVYLGVDAIWLSPIFPSPMVDGGYDISDYRGIHPDFGTIDDFDRLVGAAHARGIRVLLDLVVNHSSDQHPWFVESRSSKISSKRDWYFWRDPRPGHIGGTDGAEPNNWLSRFGGSAWEWDEDTGQYYLHIYDVSQPDLNWENTDVRAAVHELVRWWLDRGVDGFRMDVISKIAKHPDLPDGKRMPGERYADAREHYLDLPRVHDHLRELRTVAFLGRPTRPVTIGETWAITIENALAYTDPGAGELDMVLAFDHVTVDRNGFNDPKPLDVGALIDTLVRWQVGMGSVGWTGLYWGNHDQPRAASRFGDHGVYRTESAKMLAVVLFLMRGTVFVFQGEEIGMGNPTTWSQAQLRDVSATNYLRDGLVAGRHHHELMADLSETGRDNGRTPMRWDGDAHHGFSTALPWIRGSDDPDSVTVEAQRGVPGSVLEFYRELIALRKTEPAIADGEFHHVACGHRSVFAFVRRGQENELLVIAQWAGSPVTMSDPMLEGWVGAEVVISNQTSPVQVEGGQLHLAPWEVVILRRPTLSSE